MNEYNVYDILQKCKLSQLKKLHREMKKPKDKGVFGFEFVSYHKLPNISTFTKYKGEVLCQKENEEKVYNFVFEWGRNEMKVFRESKKVFVRRIGVAHNINAWDINADNINAWNVKENVEFNIHNIKISQTPKQKLQEWLLDVVSNIFRVYIFEKGHTILPAMEYDKWKEGNYGYERLVPMPYMETHAHSAAIQHSINYIKKITNMN